MTAPTRGSEAAQQEESASTQASSMTTSSSVLPAEGAAPASAAPAWLDAIDAAVIALLNVMLAAEVVLVFSSTMIRAVFNTSSMMWVDEVSPLFLVTLAFMGGAVAYGH